MIPQIVRCYIGPPHRARLYSARLREILCRSSLSQTLVTPKHLTPESYSELYTLYSARADEEARDEEAAAEQVRPERKGEGDGAPAEGLDLDEIGIEAERRHRRR